MAVKKSKKRGTRAAFSHAAAHAAIDERLKGADEKIDFIINKVSANGNPGLENSLKDLYKGNKEIKTKLDEIHMLIQPDIDRANLWKAIRAVIKTNGFIKFCKTKFGAVVVGVGVILLANAILYPFIGTSITVATLIALVKKIAEAL